MLHPLPFLLLQLATAPAAADSVRPDSAASPADSLRAARYASEALRAAVTRASAQNRAVPRGLQSYRARMQTEMGVLLQRPEGGETMFQVEQVENDVRWRRPGSYEQRVIGHRAQSLGVNLSLTNGWRQAWTVPLLYGNRITLLFGRRDTTRLSKGEKERIAKRRQERGPVLAVHPFADDRERYYRFTGGDTVARLRVRGREVPLVRVVSEPLQTFEVWDSAGAGGGGWSDARGDSAWAVILFRGELDVDASRGHIVRMRGYFVEVRGKRQAEQRQQRERRGGIATRVLARVLTSQVEAIAFVELVNGEVEERYWLPAYQRIEAHATAAVMGDARAVYRIVSRFRSYELNDTASASAYAATGAAAAEADSGPAAPGDTLVNQVHRLVWAPSDSISRYGDWRTPIGTDVSAATADDFNDIAPDRWRPTGPPRLDFRVQRFADFVHFNRIEGLYTGYGAVARFRDAAPGVTLAGNVGWAWSERTARGRVSLERARNARLVGIRAARSLDITNDFRAPLDSGSSIGALFGVDDYDYVRRSAVTAYAGRSFGERGPAGVGALLRLESGPGRDAPAQRHVTRGLTRGPDGDGFRENRGVAGGDYWRTAATVELHPAVLTDFMRPGVGALASYERGDALGADGIGWQRVEGRAIARREWGPLIYGARVDAGAVFGAEGRDPPPQQLFELGGGPRLPGYEYKEFAGDRAAMARGLVMYGLPYWRAPIRVRRFVLPAPAPALSAGVQSGWASVGDRGSALRAVTLLGVDPATGAPLSRPTNGVRTTVDLSLRFFGGALGLGVARPVDHPARWRFVVSGAQMM